MTAHEMKQYRYGLSDLIDDIRAPRSPQELTATGAQLHGKLADFYFRSQNLWSARGKTIPRKLQQHSPEFTCRFAAAFEALFVAHDPRPVVALAEEILEPSGGLLFEGYRLDAPADFQLPPT